MLVEWMTDCPIDIISVIALWLLLFFTFHSTAFILVQVLVIFDLDSCNDHLIALIVSFLIIYCMYCFQIYFLGTYLIMSLYSLKTSVTSYYQPNKVKIPQFGFQGLLWFGPE